MMLQLVYILSWPLWLRESSLGIRQECVVGARQLVAEPHWFAGSKARPATWASADSHDQCHAQTQPARIVRSDGQNSVCVCVCVKEMQDDNDHKAQSHTEGL